LFRDSRHYPNFLGGYTMFQQVFAYGKPHLITRHTSR
jgi:hypothetical protein